MSSMTIIAAKQILSKAKSLISDPNHWVQQKTCTNQSGKAVSTFSSDAYCYCAVSAIGRASSEEGLALGVHHAMEALRRVMGGEITRFNDSHIHQEVLDKFDEAIIYLNSLPG